MPETKDEKQVQQQPPAAAGAGASKAETFRRVARIWVAVMALGWAGLGLIAAAVTLGGFLARYPLGAAHAGQPLQPPSEQFPFGTDFLGRDMFSETLYGLSTTLTQASEAAVLAVGNGADVDINRKGMANNARPSAAVTISGVRADRHPARNMRLGGADGGVARSGCKPASPSDGLPARTAKGTATAVAPTATSS